MPLFFLCQQLRVLYSFVSITQTIINPINNLLVVIYYVIYSRPNRYKIYVHTQITRKG